MPTLTQDATQHIEWLGVRLDVPARWEIVRHGTSVRKGSLVFADRTRQRLQVTWTACTKRPDVARLLADHRAKQRGQDPDLVITTPVLPVGWRGMQRVQDDGRWLTRAARYDAKAARLIEVVLDDEPESDLIDVLLGDLRVIGPADQARRFRVFGLDVTVPEGFQLVGTDIQPADAALRFSTGPDGNESEKHPTLTVRRRGMADVWFDGDLRRVMKLYALRADIVYGHEQQLVLAPHTVLTGSWDVPGPRYQRLLNLHRVANACAWHDEDDNAVYEVVAVGPAKSPPSLDAVRVFCGKGGDDQEA